eukprot:scaffold1323_cov113-Cylindrotheca_fusiformis.AAC.7
MQDKGYINSRRNRTWKGRATRSHVLVLSLVFGLGIVGQITIRTLNPFLIHEVHKEDFDKPQTMIGLQSAVINWQWYNYSIATSILQPRKRLLIAQYSGFGKYEKLLNITSPINRMYAKAWGHDMLLVRGTTKRFSFQRNQIPEEQSMYNKVDLLLMALEKSSVYDQVLILDSDTLIYDFSVDITNMISGENEMLVALQTHELDSPQTHRINNGVTLWNLHHPLSRTVAKEWDAGCIEGIKKNFSIRGDQYYLVEALNKDDRKNSVHAVLDEFHYRSATVIKHFIRHDSCSWHGSGLDEREEGIRKAASHVANRYYFDPHSMEFHNIHVLLNAANRTLNLSTPVANGRLKQMQGSASVDKNLEVLPSLEMNEFSSNTPGCNPKKPAAWNFHSYRSNSSLLSTRRLLIAQYTTYGSYDKYLNLTLPMNKRYARRWGHDLVVVKGMAFKTPLDDNSCEVPPKRAAFNRFAILSRAMKNIDNYEQLLLLPDDALFYDLDFDARNLLDDKTMLVATRSNRCDEEQTSRISSAVSVWNLHHPQLENLVQAWFNHIASDLKNAKKRNVPANGDQTCLQRALKRNGLTPYVRATVEELNGKLVKQSSLSTDSLRIVSGMNSRERGIRQALAETCSNFATECEHMELG